MTEIRCKKCNRLLMKIGHMTDAEAWTVEIKCPKCGYVNEIGAAGKRVIQK